MTTFQNFLLALWPKLINSKMLLPCGPGSAELAGPKSKTPPTLWRLQETWALQATTEHSPRLCSSTSNNVQTQGREGGFKKSDSTKHHTNALGA